MFECQFCEQIEDRIGTRMVLVGPCLVECPCCGAMAYVELDVRGMVERVEWVVRPDLLDKVPDWSMVTL